MITWVKAMAGIGLLKAGQPQADAPGRWRATGINGTSSAYALGLFALVLALSVGAVSATPTPTHVAAPAAVDGESAMTAAQTIQYLTGAHHGDQALAVELSTTDSDQPESTATVTITADHPLASMVALSATATLGDVTIIEGATASVESLSTAHTHTLTYALAAGEPGRGTLDVQVTLHAANGDIITSTKRAIAIQRTELDGQAVTYSGPDGHAALALRIFDTTWTGAEPPTLDQRRAAAAAPAEGTISTQDGRRSANGFDQRFGEGQTPRFLQPGTARVEGDIGWFDRNRNPHPYGIAEVRLIRSDGTVLASTFTDATGAYSFDIEPANNLRLQATTVGAAHTVWVPGGVGFIPYSLTQGPFDAESNSTTRVTIRPGSESPETDWMAVHQSLVPGIDAANALIPNLQVVNVLFPAQVSSFQVNAQLIGIAAVDAQDFDVILHELGHQWGRSLGIDDSPGGGHIIGEDLAARYGKDAGLRLAWSEGFASFFSVAVQQLAGLDSLGIEFVGDTSYHNVGNAPNVDFDFSLEADPPGSLDPPLGRGGAADEVAVARILWDAFDGATATGDTDGDALNIGAEVFARLGVSSATDLFAGWLAVTGPIDPNIAASRRALLGAGCIMSEANVAPTPTGPLSVEDDAPTFTWESGGVGGLNPNEQFVLTILNADASLELFRATTAELSFTLPDAAWESIRTNDSFLWTVAGASPSQPETPFVEGCGSELQNLSAVVATASNDCLAGNGRIVIEISNRTATAREVTGSVTGLSPRTITVEPRSSRKITFTGRADGIYQVRAVSAGLAGNEPIIDLELVVACDGDPALADVEALIVKSCLGDNGRIDVHLRNLGTRAAEYSVFVDQVPPKINTLASSESKRVSTTGRPDGARPVRVFRNGAPILEQTVQIACDIEPEGREVVVLQSCYRGSGRFDVYVTNYTAAPRTYGVKVGNLAVRQVTVEPGETVREAVTGRPDAVYSVVVTDSGADPNGDDPIFEAIANYVVNCQAA